MGRRDASIAKITRPGISGVVPRERLFCLLDKAREFPVVWVSGPAGSGKTTLISSYVDSRRVPCLWYSLDGGDGDRATFFYYLGLAAKQAAPGKKRKSLPLFTPEYLADVPTFTRRYFESLYSGLIPSPPRLAKRGNGKKDDFPFAEEGRNGFAVVFDNFRETPEEPAFHDMIMRGLEVIPRGVNVIVLSRSEPPSSFARLRANERIGLVGWEEIRLTPSESREIVAAKSHMEPSDENAHELHAQSGGWAAGLVLMIEAGKSRGKAHHLAGKPPHREIFAYFAAEILHKTQEETRDFLLKTSFLPHMSPKMAEKLTECAQAARILARLCRDNFFTVKDSFYENYYRYHPLFREFLQARASDLFASDKIKELRRASADLLAESGLIEDAALLYRLAGDEEGLVRLILGHAAALSAQGRIKTLLEWIDGLPEPIIKSTPWLLYWRGSCLFTFNPSGSHSFFEKALQKFEAAGDTVGLYLSWAGAVNSIALSSENIGSLGSWFSMLDDLVALRGFPSAQVEMQVLSANFLAAAYEQGYHDMERWVERAIALAYSSKDVAVRTQVLSAMALYLMMRRGDLARAAVAVNLLRAIAQLREATPLIRITTRLTEAVYYEFSALHEPCIKAVSGGLKTAEAAGIHIMDYLLQGQAALSALNTGDMAAAARSIVEMASSLKNVNRHHTAFYHFLSACEALRRNRMQPALAHVDMAVRLISESEQFQGSALNLIVRAQIMHELGRHKEALRDLSRASRMGRRIKCLYIEFSSLLARVCFSFSAGEEKTGMESLRKALALGRRQGLYLTFLFVPSALAGLCATALEEGIEPEYVRELIRRCCLSLEAGCSSPFQPSTEGRGHAGMEGKPGCIWLEGWPCFLKIYTLGRFEIIRDGRPVSFRGKIQHKPLAMLKALLAFGGMEVDAERLSDALWPEAEGDFAHLSFKFTLHRLRNMIGKEDLLRLQGGRVTLDPRHCFVDVWAFEHLFEQVEEVFKGTAGAGKPAYSEKNVLMKGASALPFGFVSRFPDLAEKAIALYKGDFLAGESNHAWIYRMRERLRSQFVRMVDLAGSYHEKTGEWEKAAHYYRKALEANDLQEEFYRGIMRCCQKLGRRGEAIAAYSRCLTVLSETLGIAPTQETQALYRRLRREP